MLRFLGQRITYILSICLLIIFAIHLGMGMGGNSASRQPSYDLVRFGQRAWSGTRNFLEDLFSGDLGRIRDDTLGYVPIRDLMGNAYFNSLGLLAPALLTSAILGIVLGVLAAFVRNKRFVWALMLLTILGVSTPSFFAGLLLQQGELKYLEVFGSPLVKMAGFGWDYQHMLLPVLVLMARPLAYITRASFISLDHVLTQNYIQTAHAKGLFRRRVIWIHAFRNIAVPVLTAVGVSLRFSLSSLPVVEYFFAWPGIGFRLLEAIRQGQTRLVVALALLLGVTIQLINLALDVIYRYLDPRLRGDL